MNVIYKVVFNYATGQWTAVSEIAKGKTKSSCTNSAVVEQTTRQVKYSPVRVVSASLLLGLVSFLGTNSAYALTDAEIKQVKDSIASDLFQAKPQGDTSSINNALRQILTGTVNNPIKVAVHTASNNATAQALNESGDNVVKTALSKAIQQELNKEESELKKQVIQTILNDFQKAPVESKLAKDVGNIALSAVTDDLIANDASAIKEQVKNISKDAVKADLDKKADASDVNDRFEATNAILNSQVENINGSLATISNNITDLKDKVANAATKEELNDKVSNTAFNILNQQVNQNSTDVAEATAIAKSKVDKNDFNNAMTALVQENNRLDERVSNNEENIQTLDTNLRNVETSLQNYAISNDAKVNDKVDITTFNSAIRNLTEEAQDLDNVSLITQKIFKP